MKNTENIFFRETRKIFKRNEAQDSLPLIYHITDETNKRVKKLMHRLHVLQGTDVVLASEIEKEINKEVSKWQSKIQKLGAVPKGMWLADFDSGSGYYCWKFPEVEIKYFHGYQDGFSGRIELED